MLKSIYGCQDGGPQPYGWRQMSLMLWKMLSSAESVEQGRRTVRIRRREADHERGDLPRDNASREAM